MKIVIKTKNLDLNQSLREYINEKINSLERFFKVIDNQKDYYGDFFSKGKPSVEAWVEIEKTTLHHRKGKVFRAEAQIHLPGKSIRAEYISEDLRVAINEIKNELQGELKKYKNKLISQRKRGARSFKKETHLSPQARFYRKGRIREEGI